MQVASLPCTAAGRYYDFPPLFLFCDCALYPPPPPLHVCDVLMACPLYLLCFCWACAANRAVPARVQPSARSLCVLCARLCAFIARTAAQRGLPLRWPFFVALTAVPEDALSYVSFFFLNTKHRRWGPEGAPELHPNRHRLPSSRHRLPSNCHRLLSNRHQLPSNRHQSPRQPPSVTLQPLPTAVGYPPTAIGYLPTAISHPANHGRLPSNCHQLPSNRRRLPSNRHRLPPNRHRLPSNRHRVPSKRHQLPSNRCRLPSNRHQVPSNRHQSPRQPPPVASNSRC